MYIYIYCKLCMTLSKYLLSSWCGEVRVVFIFIIIVVVAIFSHIICVRGVFFKFKCIASHSANVTRSDGIPTCSDTFIYLHIHMSKCIRRKEMLSHCNWRVIFFLFNNIHLELWNNLCKKWKINWTTPILLSRIVHEHIVKRIVE